jgi:hypothetical protein
MARLSLTEVDRRVGELRTLVEGVTANLVELDDDVTRRLLDSSQTLSGATASAWADASGRLARLWQGQLALQALLARTDQVRGTRRSLPPAALQSLSDILEGTSVQMPRAAGDGRRALTEGPDRTDPCTIDSAVETMSKDYDIVSEVVAAVARVWGDVTSRLEGLAAAVARLEVPAGRHGVTQPNELRALQQGLDDATRTARSDPLALDLGGVDDLATRVERVEEATAMAAREHAAAAGEVDGLDSTLGEARALLEDCRNALVRLEEKIVVPATLRAALDRDAHTLWQVQEESQLARRSGQLGPVRALRSRADALLGELQRLGALGAAGTERRDELRGLLDAYRAKAQAVGLAEDTELEELYRRAHACLYTAPCDTEEAERLVAGYRKAIPNRQDGPA